MALTHLQSPSAALDALATTDGSKSGLGRNSVRILCIIWGGIVSFLYSLNEERHSYLTSLTLSERVSTFKLSKKSQIV